MKKNVFAFVGSMRGKNSTEYKTIKKFLENDMWADANVNIITADMVNIKPCLGCCNCFQTGTCTLELEDDVQNIKEMLLKADIIIISSPVYLHNISGIIKNLIDRIAYWSHTFHLVGKRAIVLSSTSTTGNEYVLNYLKKVMASFGCLVVGELSVDMMQTEEELLNRFDEIYKCMDSSFQSPNLCKASIYQQEIFHVLKKLYIEKTDTYESNYWMEHKFFDYPSFHELLREKLLISQSQ